METSEIWKTSPESEIITTRIFNTPREIVFKAWTDPEHLKNWWGPKGFTNTFNIFDLRVGGKWSFIMHGPEKGHYHNECTFVVIREPELLVWDRQSKPIFQVEVIFEEIGENETKVTFKQKFKTVEECNKLRPYVPEKNEENMDRLKKELKKIKLKIYYKNLSNMKKLSADQQKELLNRLKTRFEKNKKRHKGIDWVKVQAKLEKNPGKLWVLDDMESTGGEPDVVGFDKKTGEYIFYDCSAESPKERRSLCYDREAWERRKEHRPKNTAMDVANEMGIEMLTEEEYMELQKLENFDAKTSSWLKTPDDVRKLGGAISGEFRFGRVFIYANGAESYFGSRGFRGSLRV